MPISIITHTVLIAGGRLVDLVVFAGDRNGP